LRAEAQELAPPNAAQKMLLLMLRCGCCMVLGAVAAVEAPTTTLLHALELRCS
jgi:hypothetical protein